MTLYRHLDVLKARLLPADMAESADYDLELEALGLGVAALFDRITGRELRRNTAASFECPADEPSVVLKSYPLESVTSVTVVYGSTSTDVTDSVLGIQKASGIVLFGGAIGSATERLEIVSSGGYWCDQGDGDDLPNGATALPDDLLNAWFLQCRAQADAEGFFRQRGAANNSDKDKRDPALRMETLDILPSVRRVLQLYVRMP